MRFLTNLRVELVSSTHDFKAVLKSGSEEFPFEVQLSSETIKDFLSNKEVDISFSGRRDENGKICDVEITTITVPMDGDFTNIIEEVVRRNWSNMSFDEIMKELGRDGYE